MTEENVSEGIEEKAVDFDALMKKKRTALFFKRCFDIVASAFGLLFLAIPFLFVAVAISCTSKGPVFFRQV